MSFVSEMTVTDGADHVDLIAQDFGSIMENKSEARRILIIDDNIDNLYILRRMLISAGYKVVETVEDSRNSIVVLKQFEPQVVFLDLKMPNIDGYEVLRLIRSLDSELRNVPVVITSSDSSSDARMRAIEAGASEFCSDIYVLSEIVPLVTRLIGPSTT
jgi:CheY-like chemotaxis protein